MTRSGMRIRRPEKGDVDQITRIVQAITKREVSSGFKRMVSQYLDTFGDTCLVAEKNGKAIGFILGAVKEYGFGVQKTGWIEVLGVHPRYMGTGIGRDLGNKLISVFKKRGVRAVHTSVQWRSGDLLAFFSDLGFDRSDFVTLELTIDRSRKGGKRERP
jgi:N-acetylglutamate synthase-like GNAT family acetyltransferase